MRWWIDWRFGRVSLIDTGIVGYIMIAMPVWRRIVVGHVVVDHAIVPRVLWLTPIIGIFDRWRHILPGLILAIITCRIHCWELKNGTRI